MKNKIIILTVFAGLLLSACSDIWTVNPIRSLTMKIS